MRKASLTAPLIIDVADSKVNKSFDSAAIQSAKDSGSSDTTPTPHAQSPPKETNASSQPKRETTSSDINSVLPSTSAQTGKLSSPPPSNTTDEAHGNATESLSTTDSTALSPPAADSTRDDQATDNTDKSAVASPPQQSTAAVDDNHNHQAANKSLSPVVISLPSPSIDNIHNDPATSNSASHMDTSSPNSASEASAASPSSSPSSSVVTDNPASSNSTTANVEAPPGGGKAKRTKRKPYQTPTAEQLESLVNGHLKDKLSISAAARRAGIARSTASSLMKKHKTQGSIPERQPRGRTAPAKIQAEQAEWIDRYLLDHESATLETIRVALLLAFPNISQISLSGLQRNITLKCTRHLKRRRQSKREEQS